jgi:hypothetical protein
MGGGTAPGETRIFMEKQKEWMTAAQKREKEVTMGLSENSGGRL